MYFVYICCSSVDFKFQKRVEEIFLSSGFGGRGPSGVLMNDIRIIYVPYDFARMANGSLSLIETEFLLWARVGLEAAGQVDKENGYLGRVPGRGDSLRALCPLSSAET